MFNLKQLALILGMLSILAGSGYAVDTYVDTKIQRQLQPIQDDVKAIRTLLENYLLQELRKR